MRLALIRMVEKEGGMFVSRVGVQHGEVVGCQDLAGGGGRASQTEGDGGRLEPVVPGAPVGYLVGLLSKPFRGEYDAFVAHDPGVAGGWIGYEVEICCLKLKRHRTG